MGPNQGERLRGRRDALLVQVLHELRGLTRDHVPGPAERAVPSSQDRGAIALLPSTPTELRPGEEDAATAVDQQHHAARIILIDLSCLWAEDLEDLIAGADRKNGAIAQMNGSG